MNHRIDSYYSILSAWFISYSSTSFYSSWLSEFSEYQKKKTFKSGRRSSFISFDKHSTTTRQATSITYNHENYFVHFVCFVLPCLRLLLLSILVPLGYFRGSRNPSKGTSDPSCRSPPNAPGRQLRSTSQKYTLRPQNRTQLRIRSSKRQQSSDSGDPEKIETITLPKIAFQFYLFAIITTPQISFFFNHFQCNWTK